MLFLIFSSIRYDLAMILKTYGLSKNFLAREFAQVNDSLGVQFLRIGNSIFNCLLNCCSNIFSLQLQLRGEIEDLRARL